MEWFILACIAPFLYNITVLTDQYLSRRYFHDHSTAVLVLGSVFYPIPLCIYAYIAAGHLDLPPRDIMLAVMTGVISLISFFPYIRAIERSDSSIVVSLFQIIPIMVLILAWIFLDEPLSAQNILVIIAITCASAFMTYNADDKKFDWHVLLNMAICCILLAITVLVERALLLKHSWEAISVYSYLGHFILGFTILLTHRKSQRKIKEVLKESRGKVLYFSFSQEAIYMLAVAVTFISFASAPKLAISAGVISSLQPVYGFAMSAVLASFLPTMFSRLPRGTDLLVKMIGLAVIISGSFYLALATA